MASDLLPIVQDGEPKSCPPPSGSGRPARRGKGWLGCILIALLFSVWAMRGVGANNIVDTDAARHAMNGAFIHDLIVRGHYSDFLHTSAVLRFAKRYYGHLPALSLPYHPPLFPLIESLFFLAFGVNVFVARLALAVAVAISAVGLFRLIVASYGSVWIAACSTVTFLALPYALWLASVVMLEFPALVFVVLAIRILTDIDSEYPLGRAILFAVLGGLAVWTKQQTVFLGAVPFFYIAMIGRWRLFRKPAIWVSSLIFLVLVAALSMLSLPVHGAGVNQIAPPAGHDHVFTRNLLFYVKAYPRAGGIGAMILLAAFAIASALRLVRRRQTALYLSWALASLLVLLILGPYSARYLFFLLPPMIVLGYASLADLAREGRVWWCCSIVAGAAAIIVTIAAGVRAPVSFMYGPDETARFLAGLHAKRILYCGGTDGSFIFSYRAHANPMDTIILAGDKLPASTYTADTLERFAHRYGVDYIVLERAPGLKPHVRHPWEPLFDAPPPSAVPLKDIRLVSSDYRWNGMLRIFRFTNPSPQPDEEVTMRMNMIGGSMSFTLSH